MLLIKAHHPADDSFEFFEAAGDLLFLDGGATVAISAGDDNSLSDHRFPQAAWTHVVFTEPGEPGQSRYVRWIRWRDVGGDSHRLITDAAVYICNDRGDTIEALR